jgi:hypothetical protein
MATHDDDAAVIARHADAVATVRAFAERSGALRVVLLLDRGDDVPALMLDLGEGGALELTDGEREILVDEDVDAAPRPLPDIRATPATAIAIEPDSGELEAPLGAIAHLGDCVLALARAFGGRSVATADFGTRDPRLPLTIAAREGEPLLLAAGDRRFVLPEAR